MKQYPKTFADVSKRPSDEFISNMGSTLGSLDQLTHRSRAFQKDAHRILFDLIVKVSWLEQHFTFHGVRRAKRSGNGISHDWAYSHFMKGIVGVSQKAFTDGIIFSAVPTYFKDFFPNFTDHDPFEETEYFKFPYKNISLDHLAFVAQCHNRMEMLNHAEEWSMGIRDFVNWATNWALSYNDEVPGTYALKRASFIPYIKRLK